MKSLIRLSISNTCKLTNVAKVSKTSVVKL